MKVTSCTDKKIILFSSAQFTMNTLQKYKYDYPCAEKGAALSLGFAIIVESPVHSCFLLSSYI